MHAPYRCCLASAGATLLTACATLLTACAMLLTACASAPSLEPPHDPRSASTGSADAPAPAAAAPPPLIRVTEEDVTMDGSRVASAAAMDLDDPQNIVLNGLLHRLDGHAREARAPYQRRQGPREIRICAAHRADPRLIARVLHTCVEKARVGRIYLGIPDPRTAQSTAFDITDSTSGCAFLGLARPGTKTQILIALSPLGRGGYTMLTPGGREVHLPGKNGRFDHRALLAELTRLRSRQADAGTVGVVMAPDVKWPDVILTMEVVAAAGFTSQDLSGGLPQPRSQASPVPATATRPPRGQVAHQRRSTAQVRGSLDRTQIVRTIRANIGDVRSCYKDGLNRASDLRGRVVIQFTIAANGRVVSSKAASSTLGDPGVEGCLVQATRQWRFAQPKGGGIVVVTYPFVLRPSVGR